MESAKRMFNTIEFYASALWRDLAEGDWAIVSTDGTAILANGPNLAKVCRDAPQGGVIIRKHTGGLFLEVAV